MRVKATSLLIIAAGLLLAGCGNPQSSSQNEKTDTAQSPPATAASATNQVQLVTHHMDIQGPDKISSGWTTFRFVNASGLTHFAAIERLPSGIGVEQYRHASGLYQKFMDLVNAGKQDAAMKVMDSLPEWVHDMVNVGGVGLTAPGHTAQETVYLKPGHYMVECYVKTDGVFHSYASSSHPPMIHPITVTANGTNAVPPAANMHVTVSSETGMQLEGTPVAGRQTFSVFFEKQDKNLIGPDVHLFRIRKDTDIDAANAWVNAVAPNGLETPAPVEFLGGTEELKTGGTAYFTVTLKPGRYALISEVPNPRERGLLVTFDVPQSTVDD